VIRSSSNIRLRSGHYFDLANPLSNAFEFSDIVAALALICRFGAQSRRFYSVAEHLLICDAIAEAMGLSIEERRAVFMHDATEAFVGDMVKPLKRMLPEYSAIESRVEEAIAERFGIDFERHREAIHDIDRRTLIAERRQLFSREGIVEDHEPVGQDADVTLEGLTPRQARTAFLARARMLGLTPA